MQRPTQTPRPGTITAIRERVSDVLIDGAIDRSLDARELEQNLATVPTDAPGYTIAAKVARRATRREAVLLWLGWRLQPRTINPT